MKIPAATPSDNSVFIGDRPVLILLLKQGRHVIALDYFEWGGEAGVQVEWAKPGGEFQILKFGQTLP